MHSELIVFYKNTHTIDIFFTLDVMNIIMVIMVVVMAMTIMMMFVIVLSLSNI